MARPRVPGARLCAPSTSRSASELPKACRVALALQPFDRAAAGPADTAALQACTAFMMRIAGCRSCLSGGAHAAGGMIILIHKPPPLGEGRFFTELFKI